MKPSTFRVLSAQKLTSTGTSDTKTATIPAATSAVLITVETNTCRATFDPAGDPQTGVGHVIPKDQPPWFLPLGPDASMKFVSTTGSSVIQLTYLS